MKESMVTTDRRVHVFGAQGIRVAGTKRAGPEAIKVLVVDDEEAVWRFVGRVLSEAGHKTTLAPTAPMRFVPPR